MAKINELPKVGGFSLMPCAPDVCKECAVKHDPSQPHNQQSIINIIFMQSMDVGQHGQMLWHIAVIK